MSGVKDPDLEARFGFAATSAFALLATGEGCEALGESTPAGDARLDARPPDRVTTR